MELKLLTEAEVRTAASLSQDYLIEALRERGLIAPEPEPEPVDPLLVEAREICARAIEEVRADGQLHWVDPEKYRSGESDVIYFYVSLEKCPEDSEDGLRLSQLGFHAEDDADARGYFA